MSRKRQAPWQLSTRLKHPPLPSQRINHQLLAPSPLLHHLSAQVRPERGHHFSGHPRMQEIEYLRTLRIQDFPKELRERSLLPSLPSILAFPTLSCEILHTLSLTLVIMALRQSLRNQHQEFQHRQVNNSVGCQMMQMEVGETRGLGETTVSFPPNNYHRWHTEMVRRIAKTKICIARL